MRLFGRNGLLLMLTGCPWLSLSLPFIPSALQYMQLPEFECPPHKNSYLAIIIMISGGRY
jgi:hypothetical protein